MLTREKIEPSISPVDRIRITWTPAAGAFIADIVALEPDPPRPIRSVERLYMSRFIRTKGRGERPKVRLVGEGRYQAGSWKRQRRVIIKAEVGQ